MKGAFENSRVIVQRKEVFIGVDVHKVSWHVTARAGGEEVFNGGIPGQYHPLRRLLDRFKACQIKVAYEAGPCGFWLHDKLAEDGSKSLSSLLLLYRLNQGTESKQISGTVGSWRGYWKAVC